MCISRSSTCILSQTHLLWCLSYIVIGCAQIICGVFFSVSLPILQLGSNIYAGCWNIIFGLGGAIHTVVGQSTPKKHNSLICVAFCVLACNVANAVILEVGEWYLLVPYTTRKFIHDKQLTTLLFYAHTITTLTTVLAITVSFIHSQLTFCIIQKYHRGKRSADKNEIRLSDTEYVLPRSQVKSPSDEDNQSSFEKQYTQSWVFEPDSRRPKGPLSPSSGSVRITENFASRRQTSSETELNEICNVKFTADQPVVVLESTSDYTDRQLNYMTSFSRTPSLKSSSQESCVQAASVRDTMLVLSTAYSTKNKRSTYNADKPTDEEGGTLLGQDIKNDEKVINVKQGTFLKIVDQKMKSANEKSLSSPVQLRKEKLRGMLNQEEPEMHVARIVDEKLKLEKPKEPAKTEMVEDQKVLRSYVPEIQPDILADEQYSLKSYKRGMLVRGDIVVDEIPLMGHEPEVQPDLLADDNKTVIPCKPEMQPDILTGEQSISKSPDPGLQLDNLSDITNAIISTETEIKPDILNDKYKYLEYNKPLSKDVTLTEDKQVVKEFALNEGTSVAEEFARSEENPVPIEFAVSEGKQVSKEFDPSEGNTAKLEDLDLIISLKEEDLTKTPDQMLTQSFETKLQADIAPIQETLPEQCEQKTNIINPTLIDKDIITEKNSELEDKKYDNMLDSETNVSMIPKYEDDDEIELDFTERQLDSEEAAPTNTSGILPHSECFEPVVDDEAKQVEIDEEIQTCDEMKSQMFPEVDEKADDLPPYPEAEKIGEYNILDQYDLEDDELDKPNIEKVSSDLSAQLMDLASGPTMEISSTDEPTKEVQDGEKQVEGDWSIDTDNDQKLKFNESGNEQAQYEADNASQTSKNTGSTTSSEPQTQIEVDDHISAVGEGDTSQGSKESECSDDEFDSPDPIPSTP